MKRIIVAHPQKQHSYHLAIALDRKKVLYKYITTVYNKEGSKTSVVKTILEKLNKNYGNKLSKKKEKNLIDSKIKQFCEIRGLIFLFLMHVPILKKIYRKYGEYLNNSFGLKVAKYAIKNKVDAVIMYDTTAYSCFNYLRENAPNIIRILDMSSNNSNGRLKLYKEEIKKNNDTELFKENKHLWDLKFQERNRKELELTDYCLVASSFSYKSVLNCGIKKIFIVPYGVALDKFKFLEKNNLEKKLTFVYTGNITYGKGVNYLLKAIKYFSESEVELYLMGGIDKNSILLKEYNKFSNIHFKGFVSQEELIKIYQKADVFIFPSLGEGLSLAGMEAMACGLPLLCSENSGVNDFIEDYKNGIVFKTGSVESITKAINWLLENRNEIKEMSRKAREEILKYSWETYYTNVNCVIEKILSKEEIQ